jgi:acyl transferase domain-containing protein
MNDGSERQSSSDIAVIGMALRFPGARNVTEFWRNLRDGVESILPLSEEELRVSGVRPEEFNHPRYVKAAAYIDDIEWFDAAFFGVNAREAAIIDPQHRIFLECAWEALEDAGYNPDTYDGLIGVYAGASTNAYLLGNLWTGDKLKNEHVDVSGIHKDYLTTNVSFRLNLRGPSFTVQSFCSTSLVAAHVAFQSLLNNECDMALAGGVRIGVPQKVGYLYEEGGIMSPDGHCRTFDARAQGIVFGSGAGIVVLKRLQDALADGDHIHAVIKGSSVNNDGAKKANYMAPSVDGQAEVVLETLAMSGVEAEQISYLETHGTGTALGDPIEIAALTKAFRTQTRRNGFVAIGSVKPNIGHLDAAAGVASLIKTVLALEHKMLPPSLHYERSNPAIDFANSPFYVNATLAEWKSTGRPRTAGVTSLGFGGTNAHMVLQEAPAPRRMEKGAPWELLVLSARTPRALEQATANLAAHLKAHRDVNLSDVAYTLQVGRKGFNHRRVVVCSDAADAATALEELAPARVSTAEQPQRERPVVFMFPGLGSQYVNMGRELYETEAFFREQLDTCAEFLKPQLGFSIIDVLYPTEALVPQAEERLLRASIMQPVLFAFEYSLARLWMQWGVRPGGMIGHSLGEYVAACLAGVFPLREALRVVAMRGRLVDESAQHGAMLVVHLPEQEVLARLPPRLSLAAVNAPSLCVLSGTEEAVEGFRAELASGGVECRLLNVKHAYHSDLMEPLLERFGQFLRQVRLQPPQMRFMSNVTGTWISVREATSADYWVKHLRQTVHFAAGLEALLADPDTVPLEVGPGRTLSTFAKQNPRLGGRKVVLSSVRHPQERVSDTRFLLESLGKLWLAGVDVHWPGLRHKQHRSRLSLPTYPFQRQRYWIEPTPEPGADTTARAKSPGGLRKLPHVEEWFHIPSWKRSLPPPRASEDSPGSAPWLVFLGETDVGPRLLAKLEQSGVRDLIRVRVGSDFEQLDGHTYFLNPGQVEHYEVLLQRLREAGRMPARIIHLLGVTPPSRTMAGAESFQSAQRVGYYSLLHLSRALLARESPHPVSITIVTNGVHDVSGDEPLQPHKATVLALAKVMQQELQHTTHCVDIVLPESGGTSRDLVVEQLAAELLAEAKEPVVAYRGGHRWVQSYEQVRLEASAEAKAPLKERGVYLLTGGLGEVGFTLAGVFARKARARQVLLSRTGLPPRGEWAQWLEAEGASLEALEKAFSGSSSPSGGRGPRESLGTRVRKAIRKIQALEAAGAEVLVVRADVADPEHMAAAFAQARERFGRIDGVVHCAGAVETDLDSSVLSSLDRVESERQFRPKVHGLYVLEQLLRDTPLDFCVLFSSNASILGGIGSGAYAAANAFIDAYCAFHNRTASTPWISTNWDGWPTEKAGAIRTSLDEFSMTAEEAERAFLRVLSTRSNQVVVSTGELSARLRLWVHREESGTEAPASSSQESLHERPELQTTYAAPRNEYERTLVGIWQDAFFMKELGIHDNFFDLGGHSLLATRIISRIKEELGVNLRLSSLIENPSVERLAGVIAALRGDVPPPGPPGTGSDAQREEGEV